jgi:hypothetical protein
MFYHKRSPPSLDMAIDHRRTSAAPVASRGDKLRFCGRLRWQRGGLSNYTKERRTTHQYIGQKSDYWPFLHDKLLKLLKF